MESPLFRSELRHIRSRAEATCTNGTSGGEGAFKKVRSQHWTELRCVVGCCSCISFVLSQSDTVIHSHGSNAEYVPLAVLTWTFLKMTPTEYGPFLIEIECFWFLWCKKSNTFRQPSDQLPVNLKGLHLRNGLGMGQGA
jgi:uncharacterized membrane protein YecN with MAPEG domain